MEQHFLSMLNRYEGIKIPENTALMLNHPQGEKSCQEHSPDTAGSITAESWQPEAGRSLVPASRGGLGWTRKARTPHTHSWRCGGMGRRAEQSHGGFHLPGWKEEVGNNHRIRSGQSCSGTTFGSRQSHRGPGVEKASAVNGS